MRDSFAAEFPSAANALGRLRRPAFPREPWAWAALTGLGATAVTSAVLQLPLAGMRMAGLRDPAAWAASIVAILAAAIGLAIAWRAGEIRAVALYLAVRLAYSFAALPGVLVFCDRSGETNCAFRFAVGQWTTVAGIVAALAVVRLVRSGPPGRSAALSAAGAYITAQQLLYVPLAFVAFSAVTLFPAATSGQIPFGTVYVAAAAVIAAAVSGIVLAIRCASVLGALVPIGVIAVGYGLQVYPVISFDVKPPWALLNVLTGPAQVIALLLAWAVSHRARRSEPSKQLLS